MKDPATVTGIRKVFLPPDLQQCLAVPFYLASYRRSSHWLRWTGKGLAILLGCVGIFVLAAFASSGRLA